MVWEVTDIRIDEEPVVKRSDTARLGYLRDG